MQLYYSGSTNGFYNSDVHKDMPEDAVKINQEQYDKVFEGQSEGLLIVADKNGFPVNIETPPPSFEEVKQIRRAQYQLISDPLFFGWQRGDNTKEEWLDAVQSVKDANPYPVKN